MIVQWSWISWIFYIECVEASVKNVFPNCEQNKQSKINKKVTFNVPEYTYADAVRKRGFDQEDTNDANDNAKTQIEKTKIVNRETCS